MLQDFAIFLRSLWSEWVPLLTGGSLLAVIALWQTTSGKAVPPSFNWFIVGVTFITAAFLAWRREWISGGRGFVAVQPAELISLCENRTDVHAKTMLKPYIGKRIKITGSFRNIHLHYFWSTQVIVNVDGVSVSLWLSGWRARWFTPLPVGTEVTVSGRIQMVSSFEIYLGSVELEGVKAAV